MTKKTALITGITGQDGAYLARFLLRKNYKVIGIERRSARSFNWRLEKLNINDKVIIEDTDIKEINNLIRIFDKYRVDLILSGHDHAYSRTGLVDTNNLKNIPTGYEQAYDPEIGTVNVVSVSGPKLYEITKDKYAKTFIENKQLYQIIDIEGKELRFRSFDATGELHDEFILRKRAGQPNLLIEKN